MTTLALLQRAAEALGRLLCATDKVHHGMDLLDWPPLVEEMYRLRPDARAVLAEIRAEIARVESKA